MKKYMRVLFSLLVFTIVTACRSHIDSSSTPVIAQGNWDQSALEQVVEEWRVRAGVPGVVVGISPSGQADILLANGRSDVANDIPIKEDAQFRIASITKTFIAAEVLKLVAEGKVQLDDPLNRYLPGTPDGDVVTIRHLLSHRSGYFDPVHDDPAFIPLIAQNMGKQWTWDEVLALTFAQDLHFSPGSGYHYSNANYMLLGLMIEKLTGRSLSDVLTSDLIHPLRLNHTLYATPKTSLNPVGLVRGYATHPISGDVVDTATIAYETILSVSADTMISNAADLLTWSRALYGNESVVLQPVFQEQMLTFDSISPYGLGVFAFDTPVGTSVGHGGDTAGYLSLMEYIPSQDLSLVILVNTDHPWINLSELRDSLLGLLFGASAASHAEDLIANLKSDNPETRKNAIIALGHSHTNSDRVIFSLIEILSSDPHAENRKEAALALGLLGKDSNQARKALTSALGDSHQAVREAAQLALSIIK